MSWQWTAPGGSPPPDWLENISALSGETVKTNPKRTVRRIAAPDGKRYYVKQEIQRGFAAWFPVLSARKAACEFRASVQLAGKGIPCVRYAAFGRNGAETMLVSEAFEGAVSAKEYWFSEALLNEAKRHAFLCVLKDLLERLFAAGVRHADFHAGNLLVRAVSSDPAEPPELMLVDPAGVRFGKTASAFELAHIYADLLPEIRKDEVLELLSGLSDRPAFLAREIRASLLRLIAGEWPRRRAQILSGQSKFSRTATRGGRTFEVASTPWFAPRELPDDLALYPHETLPADIAEERWLNYFRARLEGRTFSPRCFFREKNGPEQTLFYEPER